MRMSRKAGIGNPVGVRWLKYGCVRYESEPYYNSDYHQGGTPTAGSNNVYGRGIAFVCRGVSFSSFTHTYNLSSCGTEDTRNLAGAFIGGGDTLVQLDSYLGYSDGHDNYSTLVYGYSGPVTDTLYDVTSFIKNTYAKEGTHPDSKYGYSYVTTISQSGVFYVIMTDGAGNYYGYKEG